MHFGTNKQRCTAVSATSGISCNGAPTFVTGPHCATSFFLVCRVDHWEDRVWKPQGWELGKNQTDRAGIVGAKFGRALKGRFWCNFGWLQMVTHGREAKAKGFQGIFKRKMGKAKRK